MNYSRLMTAVMAAEYAASWLCTRGLQADLHVLGCNLWLPMKTLLQFNSASSTWLGAYGMSKESGKPVLQSAKGATRCRQHGTV
jgi:hypothetical protein